MDVQLLDFTMLLFLFLSHQHALLQLLELFNGCFLLCVGQANMFYRPCERISLFHDVQSLLDWSNRQLTVLSENIAEVGVESHFVPNALNHAFCIGPYWVEVHVEIADPFRRKECGLLSIQIGCWAVNECLDSPTAKIDQIESFFAAAYEEWERIYRETRQEQAFLQGEAVLDVDSIRHLPFVDY